MPYGDWNWDEPSGQWFTGDAAQEENWLPVGSKPYETVSSQNGPWPVTLPGGQEAYDFWDSFWADQPNFPEPQGVGGAAGYNDWQSSGYTGPRQEPAGTTNRGPNNGQGYQVFDYLAAQAALKLQQAQLELQFATAKMNQMFEMEMEKIRQGDRLAAQEIEVKRQGLMQWAQQKHAEAAIAEQALANYKKNTEQQQWFSASNVMANPRPIARKLSMLGVNV